MSRQWVRNAPAGKTRPQPSSVVKKASGDSPAPCPRQNAKLERCTSSHKIPRSVRYDLEKALIGLCDVWFEEIKPHLMRNNIKLHGDLRAAGPEGGDGAPDGCSHINPGAASDRFHQRCVNFANCYSTRLTTLRERCRRPPSQCSLMQAPQSPPFNQTLRTQNINMQQKLLKRKSTEDRTGALHALADPHSLSLPKPRSSSATYPKKPDVTDGTKKPLKRQRRKVSRSPSRAPSPPLSASPRMSCTVCRSLSASPHASPHTISLHSTNINSMGNYRNTQPRNMRANFYVNNQMQPMEWRPVVPTANKLVQTDVSYTPRFETHIVIPSATVSFGRSPVQCPGSTAIKQSRRRRDMTARFRPLQRSLTNSNNDQKLRVLYQSPTRSESHSSTTFARDSRRRRPKKKTMPWR